MPALALLLATVAVVLIWVLPVEFFDRGMRFSFSALAAVLGFVTVSVWFIFSSGLPWRWRTAYLVTLCCLALFFPLTVRRVDFTGDMLPSFEYRWQLDRYSKLEAHRASHRPAATATASAELEAGTPIEVGPHDVLEYRGRERDGVVTGPALARDWNQQSPEKLWRQPVGGGYAAFDIVGPYAFTIEQRKEQEAIVAYDKQTGEERWVYQYPAFFSEAMGGEGPRATPTYADGRLYSLGATGVLACLDASTGKLIWERNIFQENAAKNLVWGMSGSPLVYDQLVVVNPGAQQGNPSSRAVLAFERDSGRLAWASETAMASYASPMLVELAGVRQVLIFDAQGVAGLEPATGERLWRQEWISDYDINAAQPVLIEGDRLLISSGKGSALLHVSQVDGAWQVDELWRNRNMKASYANPVVHDGNIYGLDEGILVSLDLATGKRHWKKGRHGHGQLLLADDLLVILSEQGQLVLVEATPEEYRELGSLPAIEGRTWNNPTLVDGTIYVRNHLEMAAYKLPLAH
ncbi:MAG: PQQ-like beta-propeller repeat protein [Pirellulales bacterium]|nr:PQQ-like beta-propeller repeat protein [Pirellulales bacterium]